MRRPLAVCALCALVSFVGCGTDGAADDTSASADASADAALEVDAGGVELPIGPEGDGAARDGSTLPTTRCEPGETGACYTGVPTEEGVGICKAGLRTCERDGEFGRWGACVGSITPRTETCNGLDDDCDGVVDQGCECKSGETRDCGVGNVGICRAGKQTCSAGKWGECAGSTGPEAEVCNGVDDNCNGVVDEGCGCKDGETRACGPAARGICKPGQETCTSGNWGACLGAVFPAAAEVCGNNLDDNCNGTVDEGCAPPAPVCTRVNKRWVGPVKVNLNENTPGTAPNSQKSHATCRDNAPTGVIFDSVNCLQSPWSCRMTNPTGGCGEPKRPCFTCQCMECSGDVMECR